MEKPHPSGTLGSGNVETAVSTNTGQRLLRIKNRIAVIQHSTSRYRPQRMERKRAGDGAQWQSACPAGVKPWVPSPASQNRKIKKKNFKEGCEEKFALKFTPAFIHESQKRWHRPRAYPQTNGETRRGLYGPWNVIQPQKEREFGQMLRHG